VCRFFTLSPPCAGTWTIQWAQVASSGTSAIARTQHTTSYHSASDTALLFGGYSAAHGHLNDLWALRVESQELWRPDDHGSMPTVRRGHVAEMVGDKLWIFGGANQSEALADLYTLDVSTWRWSKVRPFTQRGYWMTTE
jgi:hypothetical protein